MFDKGSIEKSKSLSVLYLEVAQEENIETLNLKDAVKVSEIDGLHFNEINHHKIFDLLKDIISKWL